jgi:Zn-dependent M28 family amino/carboxypeptidase
MAGREFGTPGAARARAYVAERFHTVGLAPAGGSFVHAFAESDGRTGRDPGSARSGANVLGLVTGRDRRDQYIVVSAHYDHVGVRDGQIYNGADDNASGTAALFAIARHFLRHTPRHSMVIAAFDGEEAGLVGARAFVRSPPVDRAALRLNINVDMIGRDPDDVLYVAGTRAFPWLRPIIEEAAKVAPVTLRMGHDDPADRRSDWTQDSDHYAFIEARIPALLFSVEDEEFHHRPTDDYETMTLDFYVRAVETVIRTLRLLDERLPL